ncbi:MAG: D-cysteine desulfhydrase family protein [Pseudomonadales bacterium]|jgi:L-cysteate sulfo-lyase|nr:D-cysteine desulfhydrase family protein [Pseudomonadales bacterium]
MLSPSQQFIPPHWLEAMPRVQLGHWPTPLEHLPRLTKELSGPQLWVKRDDCSGLATGGNKTRKLEFLLADAIQQGADTIVTYGAVQSNHARQTAAACAKLGLECHLLLSQRVDWPHASYNNNGNVLFNNLFGAHTYMLSMDEFEQRQIEILADLAAQNKQIYQIPPGGSNALGALGYAMCLAELEWQTNELGISLEQIVHASASSATQAGLIFGAGAMKSKVDVLGINVFHPDPATLTTRIEKLLAQMSVQFPASDAGFDLPININHAYFGEAYGKPTDTGLDAIKMVAELEGLLFDPVYSGKALAALIDQINLGNFSHHKNVVLIHTGGAASLSAYVDAF